MDLVKNCNNLREKITTLEIEYNVWHKAREICLNVVNED